MSRGEDVHLKHHFNRCLLVVLSNTRLDEKDCWETLLLYGGIENIQFTPDGRAAFVDFSCEHAPLLVARCFLYRNTNPKVPMPKGVVTLLPGCSFGNFLYLLVPHALSTLALQKYFDTWYGHQVTVIRAGTAARPSSRVVVVSGKPAEEFTGQPTFRQHVPLTVSVNGHLHTFYAVPHLLQLSDSSGICNNEGCEECNVKELRDLLQAEERMREREAPPFHVPSLNSNSTVSIPLASEHPILRIEIPEERGRPFSRFLPSPARGEERWDDVPEPDSTPEKKEPEASPPDFNAFTYPGLPQYTPPPPCPPPPASLGRRTRRLGEFLSQSRLKTNRKISKQLGTIDETEYCDEVDKTYLESEPRGFERGQERGQMECREHDEKLVENEPRAFRNAKDTKPDFPALGQRPIFLPRTMRETDGDDKGMEEEGGREQTDEGPVREQWELFAPVAATPNEPIQKVDDVIVEESSEDWGDEVVVDEEKQRGTMEEDRQSARASAGDMPVDMSDVIVEESEPLVEVKAEDVVVVVQTAEEETGDAQESDHANSLTTEDKSHEVSDLDSDDLLSGEEDQTTVGPRQEYHPRNGTSTVDEQSDAVDKKAYEVAAGDAVSSLTMEEEEAMRDIVMDLVKRAVERANSPVPSPPTVSLRHEDTESYGVAASPVSLRHEDTMSSWEVSDGEVSLDFETAVEESDQSDASYETIAGADYEGLPMDPDEWDEADVLKYGRRPVEVEEEKEGNE